MKKYILLLPFLIVLTACQRDNAEEKALEQPVINNLVTLTVTQYKNAGVQTGLLQKRDLSTVLKLNGKIDVPPQNKAKVTALANGFVKNTKLLVGDKVTKGQALLSIQSTEIVDIQKEYLDVAEQISFLKSEII